VAKNISHTASHKQLPTPGISLSQSVQQSNYVIQEQIKEVRAIDRRRRDREKELEDVNCAEMLKTANVQIKVMNQLLDRLIPSDDSHTVITEGKNYSIEVIE